MSKVTTTLLPTSKHFHYVSDMWSRKHEFCCHCKSTRFNHKAKGYCYRCYAIQRRKEKIMQEFSELSEEEILELKRPLLSHKYFRECDTSKILNIFLHLEESKLSYLKLYGEVERGSHLDLLKFEMIFNDIAHHVNRKKSYTQSLDSLYTSLNSEQRRKLLMKLIDILL